MNPRNQCFAPEFISNRCSANRTGRSRVISCHSRDIGVVMFTFFMCCVMTWKFTLSVLIKVLRSKCVVVVAKRLKVLATCREIW
jgi:hypothetical protein